MYFAVTLLHCVNDKCRIWCAAFTLDFLKLLDTDKHIVGWPSGEKVVGTPLPGAWGRRVRQQQATHNSKQSIRLAVDQHGERWILSARA